MESIADSCVACSLQHVVSCSVECASRYTKGSGIGFFQFPRDPARRCLWVSAIRRRNTDGSAWVPSKWDRLCGRHFQSGRPHQEAAHPDFAPNVYLGYPTSSTSVRETSHLEEAGLASSESPLAGPRVRRFERASERCRRAAQQEHESERTRVEMANMCAEVELNHTYACS